MKLRNYQSLAETNIFEAWRRVKRILVVLPTGCGKTVLFASVINSRVLVLAHREELITQAKDKIEKINPSANVQIEMADYKVSDYFGKKCDVVVSTVQTQCAPIPANQAPVTNYQLPTTNHSSPS